MKIGDISYWARFGAITTISALVTVVLLNFSDAIATDYSADNILRTISAMRASDDGVSTASHFHNNPNVDRNLSDNGTRGKLSGFIPKHEDLRDGKDGSVPTSMLWPAYKYIPQFGKTLRA